MADYVPILAMLALSTMFAAGGFVTAKLMGPRRPTAAKLAPYECGIIPELEPVERFPVKFYLVAMIFIVFDIELIFLYPFAVAFSRLAVFGLIEMGLFLLAVIVAYAYVLSSGALDWGPARRLSERAAAPVRRAPAGRDASEGERAA